MDIKIENKFIDKEVNIAYKRLKHKYYFSKFWFIMLNISSLLFIAILVVLNYYTIHYNNNSRFDFTKNWFVIISCISASGASTASVLAFLNLKRKMKAIEFAVEKINYAIIDYISNKAPYNGKKRDEYFIKRISEIVDATIKY